MYEPLNDPRELRRVLECAIGRFNADDAKVLLRPGKNTGGPNEPAIGTQLVVRLVDSLRTFGVPNYVYASGTYNRFGNDLKLIYRMEEYRREIEAAGRELRVDGSLSIYPDIIVHEFGSAGPNYLVIELKKDSNATDALVRMDRIKLSCMTSNNRQLRYVLGAEIRAHDCADESDRKLEIRSVWRDGKEVA
jgi:hypothetical protein